MAHLFRQIYVDELDFEALTVEKVIDLVFTEMVYRKIQQLEKETQAKQQLEKETQAKQDLTDRSRWRKSVQVLDDEERWIRHTERGLALLNHDVIWQGVVEACKILKFPEPSSATRREYFEALFDVSCFVWFQIYSDFERTAFINNLIDYVFCVCKLKYNSIV